MTERRNTRSRKLLAATIGLATVTLTGCDGLTSGNLVAPPPDAAGEVDAGNDAGGHGDAGSQGDDGGQTDAGDQSDAGDGSK